MVNLAVQAHSFDAETQKELGKAVADRFGLNPEMVREEWTAIEGYGNSVWVNFSISVRMDNAEFNELFKVAQRRAHK